MTDLNDFLVDESKVWFGEYWPEGVPKQLKDIENVAVNSVWDGFIKSADEYGTWDNDVCLFVLGSYKIHR